MEYLVSGSEMWRCDSYTVHQIGIPSMVLMERAALSVVEELTDGSFDLARVLVVCGCGNNGGDGLALARLLHQRKIPVQFLLVGKENRCTPETTQQLVIARNCGVPQVDSPDFSGYTALVDALFGTGLSREVEREQAQVIDEMNRSRADILSVDIPSGISADTGKVLGTAIVAKKTVTFAYRKLGLVLYPGASHAGRVIVREIGITDECFGDTLPKGYSYTLDDLEKVPKRNPYSNKGTFGKVLVIGGSINMSGAAYFAAKAAYRTGCGLVRIYTPGENRPILQTQLPEAILTTYDCADPDIGNFKEAISWADIIVAGPGMGKGAHVFTLLQTLLSDAKVPLILDADAINLLAEHPQLLDNPRQPITLTPHLGELSRLTGVSIPEIAGNLIASAEAIAREKQVICVLKDARTVITDGRGRVYLNQTGNSGMATGGSGDALTGIIAGLAAQGLPPMDAASLGVYIHGLAGDSASDKRGPYGVMAGDIVDCINDVL